MIYVILKIIQSGFLNLFLDGVQRLKSFLFRSPNAAVEIEQQLKEDVKLQQFKNQAYEWSLVMLFAIGLSSLFMSSIGLVLFYT